MKKPDITTILLLLFSFIVGCTNEKIAIASGDSTSLFADRDYRFIVAADPQLFRGKKDDLDRAIRLINQQVPDFVFMCGDMIESSGNLEQIQAYKDSVSGLSGELSLYHVPGNHDLGRPVKQEKLNTYREHFGPLWFHFTRGDNLFIALCSDILADPNAPYYQQQKDWLTAILSKQRPKPVENIFVFMHHPLYLSTPDEPDGYSNMPIGIRKELLDLFTKHHVRAVFSGHLHDNKINSYKGIDLITTNSITVPMGKAPAGFRIIDVNRYGYEHRYCSVAHAETQEKDSYEKANVP